MKSKDIQKAVKTNVLDIMNDRALHPIFPSRRPVKKQNIPKMQREKLYNLHKTAYFIVVYFVFKMHKILSDQILTVCK